MDGRGTYQVVGSVGAPHGLGIAEAFRRERALAPELFKVTLPGPSEITTQLEPPEARRRTWPAVVQLLQLEMAKLVEAGAREVQLDLPQVAMGLADGGWETDEAVDIIFEIFGGLRGIRRSVHLCYGDVGGRTWTSNRSLRPLLPMLRRLGGLVDCLVLELSLPEQWADRHILRELPPHLELAAGIVGVKAASIQAPDELAWAAEDLLRLMPAAGFARGA